VEAAPLKDETVLFNPGNNKFCVLNVTAAFIWELLEQPHTIEEISSKIEGQFAHVELEQAALDVQQTLQELQSTGCVVKS